MGAEASYYNLETYYLHMNDPLRRSFVGQRLRAGDPAPAFSMLLLNGSRVQLSDLVDVGNVGLVFGCWSAPPLLEQLPALEELHADLNGSAQVVLVYTREIHPNQSLRPEIPMIPPHRSLEEKMAIAAQFRDRYSVRLPIAVDDLEGTVHRSYGALPAFQVAIDRSGTVAHIAEWTSATQLRDVLTNLNLRDDLAKSGNPRLSYSETIWCVGDLTKS